MTIFGYIMLDWATFDTTISEISMFDFIMSDEVMFTMMFDSTV